MTSSLRLWGVKFFFGRRSSISAQRCTPARRSPSSHPRGAGGSACPNAKPGADLGTRERPRQSRRDGGLGRRERAACAGPAGGEAPTHQTCLALPARRPAGFPCRPTPAFSYEPGRPVPCLNPKPCPRQEMARGFKPRGAGCISEIDEVIDVCTSFAQTRALPYSRQWLPCMSPAKCACKQRLRLLSSVSCPSCARAPRAPPGAVLLCSASYLCRPKECAP